MLVFERHYQENENSSYRLEEHICKSDIWLKGLVSKIYKNSFNAIIRKQALPSKLRRVVTQTRSLYHSGGPKEPGAWVRPARKLVSLYKDKELSVSLTKDRACFLVEVYKHPSTFRAAGSWTVKLAFVNKQIWIKLSLFWLICAALGHFTFSEPQYPYL